MRRPRRGGAIDRAENGANPESEEIGKEPYFPEGFDDGLTEARLGQWVRELLEELGRKARRLGLSVERAEKLAVRVLEYVRAYLRKQPVPLRGEALRCRFARSCHSLLKKRVRNAEFNRKTSSLSSGTWANDSDGGDLAIVDPSAPSPVAFLIDQEAKDRVALAAECLLKTCRNEYSRDIIRVVSARLSEGWDFEEAFATHLHEEPSIQRHGKCRTNVFPTLDRIRGPLRRACGPKWPGATLDGFKCTRPNLQPLERAVLEAMLRLIESGGEMPLHWCEAVLDDPAVAALARGVDQVEEAWDAVLHALDEHFLPVGSIEPAKSLRRPVDLRCDRREQAASVAGGAVEVVLPLRREVVHDIDQATRAVGRDRDRHESASSEASVIHRSRRARGRSRRT